ncbi:MAG: FAD-dependent pyridine nucleotide-disulfide oxidoreductase [Chloroflexi bacterium]|nr:FAD-dependent pyridine nucleotide-disulfide oxidoreductase [Chloroflexota bacterium]
MAHAYDLVIVGMGSGGMVAAEFTATLDVRFAAVERGRLGGDCLWTGCVPSKALIASAKVAHHMRTADRYGITAVEPEVDTTRVWRRIRAVQDEIAATDDSPARFTDLGLELVAGDARVTGPHTVEAGGRMLDTRYILLCTGSRPATPPVEGLAEAGFLTSESLFELERAPESLVVIGGGPISIEMAQAFRRLGVPVTVLQRGPGILPRDEPELVAVLTRVLREEGVDLHVDVEVQRVTVENGRKVVHGRVAGTPARWAAAEILVGAGRCPNVEGLGLDEVGVAVGPRGITVDHRMRTTVPSIYAAGDLAGRFLFTHAAGYEAVRAVRDMFFPGRGTACALIPWCTFTDPELAHAGMTVAEARAAHGEDEVEVFRHDLIHSDRARADGATEGAIVIVTARGRVVGAHILAPAAGEMIAELALAITRRLKLSQIASSIHVYPTLSVGISQLAAEAAFESAQRFHWLVRRQRRP